MEFDKKLVSKILDPIHGIIRLTEIEVKFIDDPLFQRLRTIKQNTFLYKVFPSAIHSRFEHSLGVMNIAYEVLKNLQLNSFRFTKKNNDTSDVFEAVDQIPESNVQELRLAALLHDIGHGPMSHQFDSFLPTNESFKKQLSQDFPELFKMIGNNAIEHEHISLIFVKTIYDNLCKEGKLTKKQQESINIDNVMMIIESKYLNKSINTTIAGKELDILPMLTSIISSCPIDADRMDYLQRDSYFSGVKCGIYDSNRLFMSIVPVIEDDKLYLAYTESCIDSIAEFINARSNLFSQVYYHKTNRAFSAMLDSICQAANNSKINPDKDIFKSYLPSNKEKTDYLKCIKSFYLTNSDSYFLSTLLPRILSNSEIKTKGKRILNNLKKREPWLKVYEAKIYSDNLDIKNGINKNFKKQLKKEMSEILEHIVEDIHYSIDIMTDNAFKDIEKTEIKLLTKNHLNKYSLNSFEKCGDKLNKHQSVKYFVRIFLDKKYKNIINDDILNEIEACKNKILNEYTKEI
ncbi:MULTISPECIES: HD domain-containing protein [Pseudoalteromonas]|uniref:HD domain-containing protein n=1 Tax=Pseudoalteromonas TaxID=53246 RepID=UPI000C33BDC7|nr:HD domain-containing protein [Pseudoalteromonas arctica]PKG65289.1 phosphohydrolase [Pseudoalteromonas arctica]